MMNSSLVKIVIFVGLFVWPCVAHHGDEKKSFNDVNNDIAIKFLQTLADDDNAVFSPIMLSNSLLLLTNSVSGNAKDELLKFLSLENKGLFMNFDL